MKTSGMSANLKKSMLGVVAAVGFMAMMPLTASAHCDTVDGPTVADGKKAMASNNINYALKWVQPGDEQEITRVFNLSMKVKDLSPEAKELSERYFFENLIRIHRAGENAPFTGMKPAGTPVDERVLAADKSIVLGNLSPFKNLIEAEKMPELKERFERVMERKDFDANDLVAGREYIEAYVSFFKFAEGEEEHHAAGDHQTAGGRQAAAAHKATNQHDAKGHKPTNPHQGTGDTHETDNAAWRTDAP